MTFTTGFLRDSAQPGLFHGGSAWIPGIFVRTAFPEGRGNPCGNNSRIVPFDRFWPRRRKHLMGESHSHSLECHWIPLELNAVTDATLESLTGWAMKPPLIP